MTHILLEKAMVFVQGNKTLDLKECNYDIKKGIWFSDEAGGKVILVRSQRLNKPNTGKKADVETGEDQKGM
ncbi:hypothetical protein [Paenibacillus agaridevorans]|uniref:hypothetical protein n=1 Tax=Paenibacillus agaridevorans TaxID=171404 RepID=UPI001BE403CF|nr:hypothetical protein [Paenibacillus agaridevorans]